MTAVRKNHRVSGKVLRLCRTGIGQTNHRPIAPTISAPPGEFTAMDHGLRRLRRGRAVFVGSPTRALQRWGANFGGFRLSSQGYLSIFQDDFRCDTQSHAVETPIRKTYFGRSWLCILPNRLTNNVLTAKNKQGDVAPLVKGQHIRFYFLVFDCLV
jgi:hypothetical protein